MEERMIHFQISTLFPNIFPISVLLSTAVHWSMVVWTRHSLQDPRDGAEAGGSEGLDVQGPAELRNL